MAGEEGGGPEGSVNRRQGEVLRKTGLSSTVEVKRTEAVRSLNGCVICELQVANVEVPSGVRGCGTVRQQQGVQGAVEPFGEPRGGVYFSGAGLHLDPEGVVEFLANRRHEVAAMV